MTLFLVLGALLFESGIARAQRRDLRPEDLFRIQRVGAIAWTADRTSAAVEIRRPGRWLDTSIPTGAIRLLNVATGTWGEISSSSAEFIGFFAARWSPSGQQLAFLSVDTNAVVRLWLWSSASRRARMVGDLQLADALADPPVVSWSDDAHLVFLAREASEPNHGELYFRILRGRNVLQMWQRAREGLRAAVSVVDSRGPDTVMSPSRLVLLDIRTGIVRTIARGALHHLELSSDGHTATYWSESSALSGARASTFFDTTESVDASYLRVDWGDEVHHVDVRTGLEVPAPDSQRSTKSSTTQLPSLRVTNDQSGTHLWLARSGLPDREVWRGNDWVREIEPGRAESIAYVSSSGAPLVGWLLYPPGYVVGRKIPIVTVVYPSTTYSTRPPESLGVLNEDWYQPQR
ncbi:MAG: hypothetical protein ACHQSE_12805, partial [Gemmatimonadales bacterium]